MKKSLSVLVATAMVSSMFASVAFAAELTTQEKLDALIAAGIFDKDGTGQGSELEANMSREQLAKIVALLKKLEVQSGTSYTDVAADRWSAGFIQAVSKVKPMIMDGVADGVFDPSGDVTLEQLATVAVRALGLTVKTDAEVKGEVSDWAKGYVATAVANGLLPDAANTDFTKPAIRAELVEATYAAKEVLESQDKVSVQSAKATGVKQVEVTFNKAVDTAVAKLALTKGSTAVATDVKFADDKKSATLTLKDVKITAGTYTVTLSGIDAAQIADANAEFTAEDEKLTKLDFVNSNEYLAYSNKVIVKLKASNQYGENASVNAGEYNVYAGTNNDVLVKFAKNESNELLLTLDTTKDGLQQNLSVIPVNIVHNSSRLSVSKTFKLGTSPFIQKMELGPVKYSNGKDALTATGETVTFDVINYDQYGNIVSHKAEHETNTQVNFNPYPFDGNLQATISDSNSDDVTDIKISLAKNIDKSDDYVVSVWNQAGSASTKISVTSAKIATKIVLGQVDGQIAAGDEDAYIPVTAYDANGKELTVDELVSNDNNNRIKVSASTTGAELVTAGEHKGKIKLTGLPKSKNSVISVNAFIATPNANSYDNKTYNVGDARVPESIKVVTEPAKKAVAGAASDVKFQVIDQYGKEYKVGKNVDSSGNVTDSTSEGVAQYRISVTTQTYGTGFTAPTYTATYTGEAIGTGFSNVNKSFSASEGLTEDASAEVRVVVQKTTDNWGSKITEITTPVVRKIEAVRANEELTYSVAKPADLFNAVDADNKTVTNFVYGVNDGTEETLSEALQKAPSADSKFAREVVVSATDAAGNKVALPKTITSIYSANTLVAQTGLVGGKGYVIGNKKGTTSLNVAFTTNKGETVVKSVDVNVKDDVLVAKAITVGNKTKKLTGEGAVKTGDNAFVVTKVKVTDNYGVAYEAAVAQKYNYLFGVVFSVKNVKGAAGTPVGTVTVDKYGKLTITGNVTSFELTANSVAGSATTLISND